MTRVFNLGSCEFQIHKEFKHDEIFEDENLSVFVRGNGFWSDEVQWLTANEIALRFSNSGASITEQLDGQFFIFILDKSEQRFYFITDHLNFFPLYIHRNETLQSTIISDSLAIYRNKKFDRLGLAQYFTLSMCIGERTLYEGVSKLPGATFSELSPDGIIDSKTYWKVEPIETTADEFKHLLKSTIGNIESLSKAPSLTFTAGLDSRMVFSELLSQKISFQSFSYGQNQAADIVTPQKIGNDFGVKHESYLVNPRDKDFLNKMRNNLSNALSLSDGMVPILKALPPSVYFNSESSTSDLIVTATGELVYSHYYEVPTLTKKDRDDIQSIANFLVRFNADSGRSKKYSNLEEVTNEVFKILNEYRFDRKTQYYDYFYLLKLTGYTSYLQQALSKEIRIYNPIFTKEMINRSIGLNQLHRQNRSLQRRIIVDNEPKLNTYLVNGFKAVISNRHNILQTKFNYFLRLLKKGVNKISGRSLFRLSFIDLHSILKKADLIDAYNKELKKPLDSSFMGTSETSKINYMSLNYWLKH